MSPDTTFSLSVLIAIAGCFVGLAGWLHSRDTKISEDAEWKGTVNAKLDMAIGLRKDHDQLDDKHNELNERVGRVEESTKAAHRRMDSIESKM
ncbi:MAG: hypothetical protein JZU49_06225 [Sulfuricurvum sp.]|nr:hypothetical protein [Sulfuricurvum sp.]